MLRKPLYYEWQYDRLVARQQSIYALSASLAEYHAAGDSLSLTICIMDSEIASYFHGLSLLSR